MKNKIVSIIEKSMKELWKKQPNLSKAFTTETLEHEPNLSFHVANELWKFLKEYDCDFDIIKSNFNNKRPDIIFHKRGNHNSNLLVLEVKRFQNNLVREWICKEDEYKIINNWFYAPLGYDFGISLVIDEKNKLYQFSLIINNKETKQEYEIRRFKSDKNLNLIELTYKK